LIDRQAEEMLDRFNEVFYRMQDRLQREVPQPVRSARIISV
jgi:hypothetical protein